MRKKSPLAEEFCAALAAMTALMAIISVIYWLFTGLSPWPDIVLAQVIIFASGIGVLTLTSPRRRS